MPTVPMQRLRPATQQSSPVDEQYMYDTRSQDRPPESIQKPSEMALMLAAATMDQMGRFDQPEPTKVHHEQSIGIEADGKHYNLSTVVGGKKRTHDEAVKLWREGKNPELGVFNSREEAGEAATSRSRKFDNH